MEAIKQQIETVTNNLNQPPQVSSPTDPTADIPAEKLEAMGDVIDRWRLNLGWKPLDNDSQGLACQSWIHTLDTEKVPYQAYGELYERALKFRASCLAQNKNAPDFGVELLLACWNGEHGLRKELYKREIDRGRTLTTNAASVCRHCHGSNFREIERYGEKGVIRCNHEE